MRALILVDRSFARRERALLSRLEVGLADEGVRVVHAVPALDAAPPSPDSVGVYSTVVGYQDSGLPLTRPLRARRLWASIQRALEDDASGPQIDIVHCFGAGSWGIALEFGRITGAAVLLEVWKASQVAAAAVLAQPREGRITPSFCTPDQALAGAIRKRNARAEVRVAPWGVHTPSITNFPLAGQETGLTPQPDHPSTLHTPSHPPDSESGPSALAIAVLTDGHDSVQLAAAMDGLARAARRFPQIMIFASAEDGRESALWRHARRLELLNRLTLVPDMELRREPVLQMDLLLLPESSGQHRTLTLDAMAGGMVVLAAPDPMIESLIDGRTARILPRPGAEAWAEVISSILTDPARARALTDSARLYTRSQRPAAAHVSAVIAAYDALVAHAGNNRAGGGGVGGGGRATASA